VNGSSRWGEAVHPTVIDSADPVAAYGCLEQINGRFGAAEAGGGETVTEREDREGPIHGDGEANLCRDGDRSMWVQARSNAEMKSSATDAAPSSR